VKRLSTQSPGSSLRPFFEIAAVIATGVLHLVFVNGFNARAGFIGISLVAWTAYIAARTRKNPGSLSAWGFTCLNLLAASTSATLMVISAAAIMAFIALSQHSLSLCWHMLPLGLLYPIWGLIQQFLIQALVAANLKRIWPRMDSACVITPVITPICALLFGMVHLPDLKLAAGTFLLGLAFTPIYLKWRNLWPLGIYHGWLGVLFYFWILRRDPWLEVLGAH